MFNFVRSREGLPSLGSCGQYTTVVRIWEVLLWLRLPYLTDKTKQNSGSCSKLRRKGIPRSRQQPRKQQHTVKRHLTKRSARLVSLAGRFASPALPGKDGVPRFTVRYIGYLPAILTAYYGKNTKIQKYRGVILNPPLKGELVLP